MDALEAIYHRRAIRDYRDDPVPTEVIEALLADTVQAPSSMNRQGWSFLVVRGRQRIERLAEDALQAMGAADASALRAHLSGNGGIFHDAPALVVICATQDDAMALQDCCIAGQTLMLAAHARGLGTCWIGSADAWLALPETRQMLGLPVGHIPVAPIVLGYPRAVPAAPPRRKPEIRYLEDA